MSAQKYSIDLLIDDKKMTTEASKIEIKINDKTLFKFDTSGRHREIEFEKIGDVESFKAFTMQSLCQAANSAFGHPYRFRIVASLQSSPKSFTQIKELLKVSSPTVDYHLNKLVEGWIVFKNEKEKYALTILGELILGFFSKFLKEAEKLQEIIA